MKDFLLKNGIPFRDSFLEIDERFSHVKLDVGLSENAPMSQVWLELDKKLIVYGFEPVSRNIENIRMGNSIWPTKLDPDHISKDFFIVPCALSSTKNIEGQVIYVTKLDPGCSSLLLPKEFEVAYQEIVPVYTLYEFLSLFPFNRIPYIDHLKIDVQGMDYDVLLGLDTFINRIAAITIEVDTDRYFNSKNNLKKIRKYLGKQGFVEIRNSSLARGIRKVKRSKLKIEVDDPTFVNKSLRRFLEESEVTLFQKG